MKTKITFILLFFSTVLFSGYTPVSDEDTCTDWSDSIDGVQFRYCMFSEYSTYYDELQWYNGNNYRVQVNWTWQFGDNKGKSTIYLDPDETSDYSSVPQYYQINTITVIPL